MKGIHVLEDETSVKARVRISASRQVEKVFRGPNLTINIQKARDWRQQVRLDNGLKAEDALPEHLDRVVKNGVVKIRARVPYSVDAKRPYRTFAEDEVEEAEAWVNRAIEARNAGLPLPEPATTKLTEPEESPDPLFGVACRAWHDRYTREVTDAGRSGEKSNKDREALITTKLVEAKIGAKRLAEIEDTDIVELVVEMAADGYSKGTQGTVLWAIQKTYSYSGAKGWCRPGMSPAYGILARKPTIGPDGRGVGGSRPGRKRPPYPIETAATLLERVRRFEGDEFALALIFSRFLGMRVAETFAPRLEDVDELRRQIYVHAQRGAYWKVKETETETGETKIVTKTNVPWTKNKAGTRRIPVPDVVWPYVEAQLRRREAEGAQGDAWLLACSGYAEGTLTECVRKVLRKQSKDLISRKDGIEDWYLTHDGRNQCSTDLLLAGVAGPLRSAVMGHSLDSQREGASAVTLGVYTSTHYGSDDRDDVLSDHDVALAEVAKQYDTFIRKRLGGRPLIAETPASLTTTDWLTAAQTAEILGLTARQVHKLVKPGIFEGVILPTEKSHDCAYTSAILFPRSQVEAELARRENSLSLPMLTGELNALGYNLTMFQLLPFVEANRVPFTKISPNRFAFPQTSVDLLIDLFQQREEFLATHFYLDQMRNELGLKVYAALLQRWKARGLISPVTPPIAKVGVGVGFKEGVSEWFLRSEVIRVWNVTQPPSQQVATPPERVHAPRSRSGRAKLQATG